MPKFKFNVQLSATVSVISSSEEEARKLLREVPTMELGYIAKMRRPKLIAVDGKPPVVELTFKPGPGFDG